MTSLRTFYVLLLLALLGVGGRPAQAQRAMWASAIPDWPNGAGGTASCTDAAGNTYVAGCFRDQMKVGAFTIQTTGQADQDIYIAKIDSVGRVQWLQRAGSSDPTNLHWYDYPRDMAVTAQGDLFLAGYLGPNAVFGTAPGTSAGFFLARMSAATGATGWVKSSDGSDILRVEELGTDDAGNCYMVAELGLVDSLGRLPLLPVTLNGSNAVVAKCTPAGDFVWASQLFCAGGSMQVFNLGVSPQGETMISGISNRILQVGSQSPPPGLSFAHPDTTRGSQSNFCVRYDAAGTPQWLRGTQGVGISNRAIRLDRAGNAYVALGAQDTAVFGGLALRGGGMHLLKLNAAGTGQWSQRLGGRQWGLALGPTGNVFVSGSIRGSAQFGTQVLTTAGGMTSVFAAELAPDGQYRWVRTASENVSGNAVGFGIGVDAAGRVYLTGRTTVPETRLGFDGWAVQGYNSFVVRLAQAAQVSGRLYLDQNGNGQRDASERTFPRPVLVSETTRPYAATSSSRTGAFTVFADTGAYQVQVPHVPAYYTLSQGGSGYAGHLRTYGQTDTARVFGLAPVANRADVRVTLTPYGGAARRGFANRYRARVENLGTTTVGGQLTVQLDGALAYVGAVPAPAQQAGNRVSWTFGGLAPFGVRDFVLAVDVPLNVALGTVVRSGAEVVVAADLNLANNVDSVRQVVMGSFDPNDLTVNYTALTPAQVAAGTLLDYVIRFQNMGTDTAFTVVIQDTLPAHLLQLGTLELVGASHDCTWDVLANGQLVVRFDSINLPDHNVSTMGSLGFVRFQVKPTASLTPGVLIPNTAHITFDYNTALATNQVTTLVQAPNGLVAEAGAAAWSLWPNPATEAVTLTGESATAGRCTVTVVDARGRVVRTETPLVAAGAFRHALPVGGLAPGLYVVRLTLPDGHATARRLVVGGN